AGAVFVPIDPDYPEEMMGYMLENAGIQTLLMSSQQLFSIPAAFEGQTVVLDMLPEEEQPTVEVAINPSDAAYMIYTSGSSGKPKGVLVSQGNIAHYLRWANEYYFGRSTDAAFGLFTSLSFDLSLTGLLGTLIRGACLQIFSEDRPSSEVLQSVFGPDSEVQATKLTPSHISLLDQIGLTQSPVQTVIVGGEALQPRQLECLFELNPGIVVHNEYGPTETTVGCTVESFTDPKQAINIGQPIANATAYVLNDSQQIVPIGTAGELYIGGRGVALAYHEQPALTAERFLDDPFRPGQRMYRTGDKACWLEDGRLQFLGRIDGQLKINGYRIEPALIESALLEISGIQQAVVLAAEGTSNRLELRAYLRGQQLDGASNIRSQLEQKIPHYMLPTAFYEITDIPLSTNGKVDANALLASRKAKLLTDAAYKAPENDMENFLLSVFAPLVSADPLSTRQNFFSVGLDSLKVVQAQTQLEARHPGSIKIHEIFSHPSIEKLSTLLSQRLGIQDTEEEETQILDF
ncbi:MAG: non-ribosomal peptide synthetase, partial [Bacteroidota bacterium]